MKNIKKNIHLNLSPESAFSNFVNEIDTWWPRDYRWCEHPEATMSLDLENKVGMEISPDGKHIQWAQILSAKHGDDIELLWRMDPNRTEITKAENCSRVKLTFSEDSSGETDLELTHYDFNQLEPGQSLEDYHSILDSDDGWIYLLRKFKQHCQEHEFGHVNLK